GEADRERRVDGPAVALGDADVVERDRRQAQLGHECIKAPGVASLLWEGGREVGRIGATRDEGVASAIQRKPHPIVIATPSMVGTVDQAIAARVQLAYERIETSCLAGLAWAGSREVRR